MQCNSMFVITSHSDIFWLVTHSSPINRVGGHVFHQIQNTVCFKTTASICICRKMFFFMGIMKKELIRVHSWKPTLKTPTLSYYISLAIILSRQKAHIFFSSISPLYVFLWTNTMSDSSSHKNLT